MEEENKMKNELFKGLEQACKEFNNWQGKACIFIDFDDMNAWCEVFECRNYHSEEIVTLVRLVSKDDLYGRNDRYSLQILNDVAKAKLFDYKAGVDLLEISDDYRYAEILY